MAMRGSGARLAMRGSGARQNTSGRKRTVRTQGSGQRQPAPAPGPAPWLATVGVALVGGVIVVSLWGFITDSSTELTTKLDPDASTAAITKLNTKLDANTASIRELNTKLDALIANMQAQEIETAHLRGQVRVLRELVTQK